MALLKLYKRDVYDENGINIINKSKKELIMETDTYGDMLQGLIYLINTNEVNFNNCLVNLEPNIHK